VVYYGNVFSRSRKNRRAVAIYLIIISLALAGGMVVATMWL